MVSTGDGATQGSHICSKYSALTRNFLPGPEGCVGRWARMLRAAGTSPALLKAICTLLPSIQSTTIFPHLLSLPLPAAAPPSPVLLLWMSNSPSGPPIPPPLHSSSQEKQERTSPHSNPKPQSERQNRAARANISASAFWVTIKRIM